MAAFLLPTMFAVRKDAFLNSIIIEEAGVILKSKGMVTLTKENLLVSVFKKVSLPQIKSVDCTKTTCRRYNGRIRCSTNPKIVNETESASHWSQVHVRSLTEEYIDRINTIKESYKKYHGKGQKEVLISKCIFLNYQTAHLCSLILFQ